MDRAAWWAPVHEVAEKSDTTEQLNNNNKNNILLLLLLLLLLLSHFSHVQLCVIP